MWFGKEDTQEVKELKAKVDDLQLLYLKEKSLKYTPRVSILDTSHDNNPLYCREAVQIKEVYESLSEAVKVLNSCSKDVFQKEYLSAHPVWIMYILWHSSGAMKNDIPNGMLSITEICSKLAKLFTPKHTIGPVPKKFDQKIVNVATLFIEFQQLFNSKKCDISFGIPKVEKFSPILHERMFDDKGEYIINRVCPGLVINNQILVKDKVITSNIKPDQIR